MRDHQQAQDGTPDAERPSGSGDPLGQGFRLQVPPADERTREDLDALVKCYEMLRRIARRAQMAEGSGGAEAEGESASA